LKRGWFGEALVDEIAKGAEIARGQGWGFFHCGTSCQGAAILSDPGHERKCSAAQKRMVGEGSDFRSVKSSSTQEPKS
jgi:hypothetical protein